jgi:hypothetical protein
MEDVGVISRRQKGLFVLLLDQSAAAPRLLVEEMNRWLAELVDSCDVGEESVRDLYDLAVLRYFTRQGAAVVEPAVGGVLRNQQVVSIQQLAEHSAEVNRPIWFESVPCGDRPTRRAFGVCRDLIANWVAARPRHAPPVMVHVTAGPPTDGDPAPVAAEIGKLRTEAGSVIVANWLYTAESDPAVSLPSAQEKMPTQFGRELFGWSSEMPEAHRVEGGFRNRFWDRGTRIVGQNGSLGEATRWLWIFRGTRPTPPHLR